MTTGSDEIARLKDEIISLLSENVELRYALQWALDQGGWRLMYFSSRPIPEMIEWTGSAGDHGKVKPASIGRGNA